MGRTKCGHGMTKLLTLVIALSESLAALKSRRSCSDDPTADQQTLRCHACDEFTQGLGFNVLDCDFSGTATQRPTTWCDFYPCSTRANQSPPYRVMRRPLCDGKGTDCDYRKKGTLSYRWRPRALLLKDSLWGAYIGVCGIMVAEMTAPDRTLFTKGAQ